MNSIGLNRICVYGAGAIGGWLGAGLASTGANVSVVARAETLAALKTHGLRVKRGNAVSTHQVTASANPADLGVQDLVVIAVKAPALREVARHIAPLIGPATVVLTAMNGVPWWFFQGFGGEFVGTRLKSVDATGEIERAIPSPNVVGCVVHASCSVAEPGLINHHFGSGLIIGEPSGAASPRAQALVELLTRAGFTASLSAQIQKDAWYKLWGNMTVNPISAITGATTDLILGDDLVRHFVSSVMLEAKEIGARMGIPIDQQPADRHAITMKLGAFKTSMLQDVEANRAVELDALVSVVKELGMLTNVPTPFTDALLGLSRLHARVRGLYPVA